MVLSVPLALLGALLFAVSAALQQRAARTAAQRHHAARTAARRPSPARVGAGGHPSSAEEGAPPPRVSKLLVRLARDPLWLLGWAAGVTGFGAQALALHFGSIVIVQALLVTQLLFAIPLGAMFGGRRPLRRDWSGAAVVCAGLVLLVTVRGAVPQTTGQGAAVAVVVAVAAGLIGLLLLAARSLRSYAQSRTAALAVAAGICFCLTAVFVVFAGDDLARRGLLATALDWPPAALAASTVLGTVLVQSAFAGGSLATAMTAMTVTDPVAGWIAGMVVFDAPPAANAGVIAGSAVAIVLIVVGVAVLATSPSLHDERRVSPGG
ncbi:DMT family transporter [Actinoallomurus sp. CA-150999]|uniref:DMT family transporter n=1 Tax=Actinoallomurus sp. CA-150999 TaxID=3239887 RepID=UPI003D8CDDB3